jgi:hypothetical protein
MNDPTAPRDRRGGDHRSAAFRSAQAAKDQSPAVVVERKRTPGRPRSPHFGVLRAPALEKRAKGRGHGSTLGMSKVRARKHRELRLAKRRLALGLELRPAHSRAEAVLSAEPTAVLRNARADGARRTAQAAEAATAAAAEAERAAKARAEAEAAAEAQRIEDERDAVLAEFAAPPRVKRPWLRFGVGDPPASSSAGASTGGKWAEALRAYERAAKSQPGRGRL